MKPIVGVIVAVRRAHASDVPIFLLPRTSETGGEPFRVASSKREPKKKKTLIPLHHKKKTKKIQSKCVSVKKKLYLR